MATSLTPPGPAAVPRPLAAGAAKLRLARAAGQLGRHRACSLPCALTVLVPLYFTVAMALKSTQQAASGTGFGWPWPMHFENFKTAWDLTNFPRAFTISFAITVVTSPA